MLLVQGSNLEYHFDTVTVEATLDGVVREGLSEEAVFELLRHHRKNEELAQAEGPATPWS